MTLWQGADAMAQRSSRPTNPRRAGRPPGQPSKSREEIAAAAGRVFRALGYHHARMEDVAAELEITKGSLYHYVRGKEDLLFETVLRPYEEAVQHLQEVAEDRLSAPEKLREIVRRHLANTAAYHPAIAVYLEQARHLPVPREIRRLDQRYVAGVRRILVDGMREGTLRTQDPAIACAALLGTCNWFAVNFDPDSGWEVEHVAEAFAETFLHGAATASPHTSPHPGGDGL